MAEMVAIIDSLTKLEDWLEGTDDQGATVWTDSRSSIDAIYSPIITQALALEANNVIPVSYTHLTLPTSSVV